MILNHDQSKNVIECFCPKAYPPQNFMNIHPLILNNCI